jgi:predicted nucleic-acid-binding protein
MNFKNNSQKRGTIKSVGLDTGPFVNMILKEPQFYIHNAKMIRQGRLFVNYIVIREAWGVLVHEKNVSKNDAGKLINNFVKNCGIKIIREADVSHDNIKRYYDLLKKQESQYRKIEIEGKKDKDLLIISIYKVANISCIFTRNVADFQMACRYLKMKLVRQLSDAQLMMKDIK